MPTLRLVLLTACLLLPALARADVLVIEHAQQGGAVNKPGNGLSMAEVESRYGSPLEKRPAVGEPPISQWIYAGYIVYFEHDRVLHSVTRRPSDP
jgi:hypothetical protein